MNFLYNKDNNKNNILIPKTSKNIMKRVYSPEFVAPFSDGTMIYLIQDSTNYYVYYDGINYQLTNNKSIATGFRVFNFPFVYKNYEGGVALQTYSGLNSNQKFMRHSGYICYSTNFESNFDYSWRFDKVGKNKYRIFNWFPENGVEFYYLSMSGAYLQIRIDNPIVWRVEKYWNV